MTDRNSVQPFSARSSIAISPESSSSSYEKGTLDDAVNEVLGKLLSFDNDLQRDIFVIKFYQKLPQKQKETLYEHISSEPPPASTSASASEKRGTVRNSVIPFAQSIRDAEKDILRRFRKSKRSSIDTELPSQPKPSPVFIEVTSNHMCENDPRSIDNYTPLLSARKQFELSESEIIYVLNKVVEYIDQGRWKLDGDVVVRARDIYISDSGEFVPAFRQAHPTEKSTKKARYGCDMYWKPPELLMPEEEITTPPVVGEKKDVVWTVGVLAYELAEKFPPYFDKLPPNAYRLIVNPYSELPKMSGNWSQEFRKFMQTVLQRDLRTRPTFDELKKLPFLTSDSKTKNLSALISKVKAAAKESASDESVSDGNSTGSDEIDLKDSGMLNASQSTSSFGQNTYNWNNIERQNTVVGTENLNIQDLVKRLRDPIKGVKIAKRSYKLKSYYSCFIGSELVDWLVVNLPLKDREEAVAIGEMLMFRGIIFHVANSEPFSDGYKFFRFGQDVIKAERKETERVEAPFVLGLPSLYFGENEISYLVTRMTDAERGVEIKNRRYHLRTYETCFIGQDAVSWMVKEFQLQSREEAVKLGQLLLQRGTFHHVHDDHNFEDKYFFYRFYKDEKKRDKEEKSSSSLTSSSSFNNSNSSSPRGSVSSPGSRPGSTNGAISPPTRERRNSVYQSHVKSLLELLSEKKNETPSPEEQEQKKIQFISQDLKKAIQTRGSIAAEEITWLISTMSWEEESEKVRETAAATLASFAFPEEISPFVTKQIMNQDGFHKLLWYASNGLIKVHREIDRSEIQFGNLIAQGAGGMVFEGTYKDQAVAVKVFNEDNIAFSVQDFTRELALMSMLKHENLVLCLGACTKPGNYFIVQELMKGGSLHQFLHNEDVQWDFELLVDVALQIAKPTAYLHNLEIIHRDLKSMNYLLASPSFSQPTIKLTDFGISRAVESLEDVELEGTPQWMAPEVFNKEKYDGASDVYSFAIVMWEMVTRQDPWITVPLWKIPELVTKGERPPLPPSCPEEFAKLIKACWQTDPSQRPDFNQITDYLQKLKAGETPKSRALTNIGSQRKKFK